MSRETLARAAPVPERYVNARELSALLGVSLSTVRRFTAAGMPSETWGMGHTRCYLPTVCIDWARARADTITGSQTVRPVLERRAGRTEGEGFDG
jgi:phage terminase Nu1 subunit (DNA packaging protein)